MILPPFPVQGQTPIIVTITNGISEGGGQLVAATYDGDCIFDETTKTKRGKDGIDIRLSGLAIIFEDIAPDIQELTGSVAIKIGSFGLNSYKILNGKRVRNFDGSVHHTELELI